MTVSDTTVAKSDRGRGFGAKQFSGDIIVVSLAVVARGKAISGGLKVLIEFMKEWSKQGVGVHLVTTAEMTGIYSVLGLTPPRDVRIVDGGLGKRSVRLSGNELVKSRYLWRSVSGIGETVKVVASSDEKAAIFSPSAFLPNVLPALVAKSFLRRRWMVAVYHFVPSPGVRKGGFVPSLIAYSAQNIALFLCRRADVFMTETSFMRKEISRRLRIDEQKIMVASGGIDKEFVDSISSQGRSENDACYVGRLHPTKGVYDLPKIWNAVVRQYPDACLTIAGPESKPGITVDLLGEIRAFGIENNVIFTGQVSEEDKFKLMKSCRILIHPSYEEGVPVTFIEAAYCGMEIVTYSLPSYNDISHWLHLIPMGDVDAMSKACIEILGSRTRRQPPEDVLEHQWSLLALKAQESMIPSRAGNPTSSRQASGKISIRGFS